MATSRTTGALIGIALGAMLAVPVAANDVKILCDKSDKNQNLYQDAGSHHPTGVMKCGEKVTILYKVSDAPTYRILRKNGEQGYVAAQFIDAQAWRTKPMRPFSNGKQHQQTGPSTLEGVSSAAETMQQELERQQARREREQERERTIDCTSEVNSIHCKER